MYYTNDFEDVMIVINKCLKYIRLGADPRIEIPFTINVLECILDTDFTEEQYEEIYKVIEELI